MTKMNDTMLNAGLEELDDGRTVSITVSADSAGERLDKLVSDAEGISRSLAAKLIEDGRITVGQKAASKNYKARTGDIIEIDYPEPEPCEAIAEDIPLDVIYEDSDIIVINKPEGMIVHPATGIYTGTLVNALLYHCKDSLSGIGGVVRPGIVHRIDKDTSGLLVVAKNDRAHLHLAEQIKEHSAHRIYRAVCVGNIKEDEGTIDLPIGRHPTDRKRMAVIRDPDREARDAVTHYRVLARFAGKAAWGNAFTYIECRLETGRTHQIRVHMLHLGHPLIGDPIYAHPQRQKARPGRLMLHAWRLAFNHPADGRRIAIQSPIPAEYTPWLIGHELPEWEEKRTN